MYAILKGWLLKLFSKKTLFRYEYKLRYFFYLLHKGSKCQCNICGAKIKGFIETSDDKLCPRCGSLQRTRRLWQVLRQFLKPEIKILDFSPSRSIYRKLKAGEFKYTASDLSGDFISDVSFDITQIDAPDNNFDLILCYHILEHIIDDVKAMEELKRVMVQGGVCLIQTPFKEGDIYEDYTITSPEGREKHFGQSDHVRVYSIDGLKERLEGVGWHVEVNRFKVDITEKNGFKGDETILICKK